MIPIRSKKEIECLRKSAELLVKTFRAVEKYLKSGVSTEELDAIAYETIVGEKGIPAFKGYNGYPASICVSINEEVVHGIPGKRKIKEGELIGVDIGVNLNGWFTDAARTYAIGPLSPEKERLLQVTHEALFLGIRQCRPKNRLSDISHAIQNHVESHGFSVVRSLVGHGIGRAMHEEPQIPNYGLPHQGPELKPGMVFAIEPMVNMGTHEVRILDDGWTVVTADRFPSAHFEHTVVVTEDEPMVLTQGLEAQPYWKKNG